jgi:hypothetical protein
MKVKTTCIHCKKEIYVDIPKEVYDHLKGQNLGCSCNECVPVDSAARNGIEESVFVEWTKDQKSKMPFCLKCLIVTSILFIASIFINKFALIGATVLWIGNIALCFKKLFPKQIRAIRESDDLKVTLIFAPCVAIAVIGIVSAMLCIFLV